MESELVAFISSLFNGVLANAVYDRVKLFAKDKPDEYEKNDLDAFKAYLLTSNHNEITLKLDDILMLSQQNKDIGSGNGLTLKELLESAKEITYSSREIVVALKSGLSEISSHLKNDEELKQPELELGLKLCQSHFTDNEKPFYTAKFQIAPYVKNLGNYLVKSAVFEIQPPIGLKFELYRSKNDKAVYSHAEKRIQYDISLFGGKTYAPLSFLFSIQKKDVEVAMSSTIHLAFRWESGFVEKYIELKDFFKHADNELVNDDFQELKPNVFCKLKFPNFAKSHCG